MNSTGFDSNTLLERLKRAYEKRMNEPSIALKEAEDILSLSREMGIGRLVAESLNVLSLLHMIRGDYQAALAEANESIGILEELKDERGIADAKYNIAGVYYKSDNFHLGLVYLLDCLSTYRKYKDHHNLARTLKSMGTIYDYFGDTDNSVKVYEEAIAEARLAGDPNLESNVYNPLSGILLKKQQISQAMDMINKAIAMKRESGDTRGLAFSIYGRGKVLAAMGRFEEAESEYLNALDIHESMGEKLGKGMVLFKLGQLYVQQSKLGQAEQMMERTVHYASEYAIVYLLLKAVQAQYRIYKLRENNPKALETLEHYVHLRDSVSQNQTNMVIRNYELITRMKDMEQEAEKAAMKEKQEIAERTAKMKQDFLSIMSHEIRTPLNAIISITSLLDVKQLSEDDRSLFQALRFASDNLLMLINDILDYTRLDSGKVQLDNQPTDLRSFVEKVSNMYRGMALEKGLEYQLQVIGSVQPLYLFDETKLGQILGNIISNAVKYTDHGQVKIEVACIEHTADVDRFRFSVSDTGNGISMEQQELIFESFYQPEQVATRNKGGSGLGLAIVRKLAELFDTEILLKSKLEEGSTFYFDLAIKISHQQIVKSDKEKFNLEGKHILVVEDNLVNAMVIRKLLNKAEAEADHVISGNEAIRFSSEKKYDIILMDIHMPGMSGIEAAACIRKQPGINQHTPIFALTADVGLTNEYDNEIFDGVLYKPIEMPKLMEAIHQVRS